MCFSGPPVESVSACDRGGFFGGEGSLLQIKVNKGFYCLDSFKDRLSCVIQPPIYQGIGGKKKYITRGFLLSLFFR